MIYRSSRPEMFCKEGVLKNFAENTCPRASFLIKLQVFSYQKKRLWHRCFPVNLAKFLRIPFFIEHFRWLLLDLAYYYGQWISSLFSIFWMAKGSGSQLFFKIAVYKSFVILTGKHVCWSLFLKRCYQYRCCLVNIAKHLRTAFSRTPLVAASGREETKK